MARAFKQQIQRERNIFILAEPYGGPTYSMGRVKRPYPTSYYCEGKGRYRKLTKPVGKTSSISTRTRESDGERIGESKKSTNIQE